MGQAETKFGLSSNSKPTVIPTIVSFSYPYKTKQPSYTIGNDALKTMKAKKKQEADTELTVMRSPYQNGRVMDWEQVESIYQYCIENSGSKNPEGCSIVVTSDPLTAVSDREKLTELLVEKFNVEQVVFEAQSVLNMRRLKPDQKQVDYSKLSGIGVNSGVSYTSLTPVLNNKPAYDKTVHMPLGGAAVSSYLHDLLRQSGYVVEPSEIHRVGEHVKKNMAYCAVDFQQEVQDMFKNPRDYQQELELATGEKLVIAQGEAFKCVEPLFNPELIGHYNASSFQKTLYNVIENNYKSDSDKRLLYSNIVLSGGNSLLVGLKDRLTAEVKEGLKQSESTYTDIVNIDYISEDPESESVNGSWLGAKQWTSDASDGTTSINWITRREYADQGKARIVKNKCY
jgi:actin-related protein 3